MRIDNDQYQRGVLVTEKDVLGSCKGHKRKHSFDVVNICS